MIKLSDFIEYTEEIFSGIKNTVGDKTVTSVTELDFSGRVNEIARIMGGENPSELILKSAEEELRKAQKI